MSAENDMKKKLSMMYVFGDELHFELVKNIDEFRISRKSKLKYFQKKKKN